MHSPRFAAAIIATLVAPLLLGAVCGGGEGSSLPDLTPFTAEEEGLLHEIRDQAAEVRGLEISPDTKEGTLTREQLTEYVDDVYEPEDDELAEIAAYNAAYRLLHMIGPDDDIIELVATSDAQSILGFFTREDDSIVLITDPLSEMDAYDEMILAHEYVHSFQHHAFDLNEMDKLEEWTGEDDRTEYSMTLSCLREGDASLAMLQFMEERYGPDWRSELPLDDEDDVEEEEIPPAIERYMAFDYNECVTFAQALYDHGGWEAINDAYERPPTTTEQILHPEKYLDLEASRSAAPDSFEDELEEGWSVVEVSPFGEFDVYNYILTNMGNPFAAEDAAEGWGAGWFTLYEREQDEGDDPHVLLHLQLDWDSSADFSEFMLAFGEVVLTVTEGEWDLDPDGEQLRWDVDGEHGHVTWDEDLNRVDISISSERAPLDAAAEVLRR